MNLNKKALFFIVLLIITELWFLKIISSYDILSGTMYSLVGTIDSLMHIKANDTKEGYLAYGPYHTLTKGKYEIKYKVFLENLNQNDIPSRNIGYCDINIDGHPEMGKSIVLTVSDFKKRNPQKVAIKFISPEGMPKIEYRVYQFGGNKLSLLSLKLYDIDIRKHIKNHLKIVLIVLLIALVFVDSRNKLLKATSKKRFLEVAF